MNEALKSLIEAAKDSLAPGPQWQVDAAKNRLRDAIKDSESELESDEMRDAYDLDDPKHPDYTERIISRAEYLEDR